jgi:hypothetical protein
MIGDVKFGKIPPVEADIQKKRYFVLPSLLTDLSKTYNVYSACLESVCYELPVKFLQWKWTYNRKVNLFST